MSEADDRRIGEAKDRLDRVRARRGYLLPHHGLMAVAAPDLLEAYDETYTALTLVPRRLSAHDKEFVWLAILIATDEAIATHHIAKFREAGGAMEAIETITRLVALWQGAARYRFLADHWRSHLPGFDARRWTARSRDLAAEGTSPRLVLMAEVATRTCFAQWPELGWAIEDAYGAGVDELDLAEALALTMFPGSVPHFVEACGIWRQTILSGRVAASPVFAAWAELSGQGGYDEATAGR